MTTEGEQLRRAVAVEMEKLGLPDVESPARQEVERLLRKWNELAAYTWEQQAELDRMKVELIWTRS